MRRCLSCVILCMLIMTGCTTTRPSEPADSEELQTALRESIASAIENVPSTMHLALSLEDLLPPASRSLTEDTGIPNMQELVHRWEDQVRSAFRTTVLRMPDFLIPYSKTLPIQNPQDLLRASNDSVTDLLFATYPRLIEEGIRSRLVDALPASEETYRTIVDRQAIWNRAAKNLGDPILPTLADDPTDHLVTLFLNTYRTVLAEQEEAIRTTPMRQGSGSIYEIFQQELNNGPL